MIHLYPLVARALPLDPKNQPGDSRAQRERLEMSAKKIVVEAAWCQAAVEQGQCDVREGEVCCGGAR